MQHLTLEAIARLVDEAPEPEEALHLRTCLACRRELGEMRLQTEELAQLPDLNPSPAAWDSIEARLQAEGLIRRRRVVPEHAFLRIAASVAVLAMGSAAGMAVWNGGGAPSSESPYRAPAVAAAPSPGRTQGDDVRPAEAVETASPVRTAALETAEPAAEPPAPATGRERTAEPGRARSTESAGLGAAETEYLRALESYARAAAAEDVDPVTRLATLEGMVRATRSALERAPDDPVINGYHLAAMGARDATLRQLARSSEETWY